MKVHLAMVINVGILVKVDALQRVHFSCAELVLDVMHLSLCVDTKGSSYQTAPAARLPKRVCNLLVDLVALFAKIPDTCPMLLVHLLAVAGAAWPKARWIEVF
eukprot:CAMPEP_0167784112 /NCGR_PEP_ID=MMETSP0111_2-20121227/7453_1 /TAXON_ID=91324 /ORGANISM="Lotharella globosa, Strain CCCM811" /LENGTH=102 /DNA_ID=CAMNT_0007675141 /DNA_START=454 /DNA_END=762 /DNA_ORIENTATION=-